jgi:hypothetical protein
MNCSFRKCLIKIIILLTISLFYACDGGDGSGVGTSSPDDDDSGGGGVSGLNPELPGRFLFTYDWNKHTASSDDRKDGGLLMDIKTGSYTKIPNTDWAEMFENDGYASARHSKAVPIKNSSSMFLVQSQNTSQYIDGSIEPFFLAYLQDFNGNMLGSYLFPYRARSDIQMSSDANYLALFSNSFLRILQATSTGLTTIDTTEYSAKPFSWLSDNRLIVVSEDGRSFLFTSVLSTSIDTEKTIPLPNDLTGTIVEMVVSSDYMRIAFIVMDGDKEVPWVMNIDGSGLRKLAESADSGGFQKFGNLQWSPDDAYIMVQEPFIRFPGDGITVLVVPTSRYVIPSQDSGEVYMTAEDAQLRSPDVIRLKFPCGPQDDDEECDVLYDVEADIYWVP